MQAAGCGPRDYGDVRRGPLAGERRHHRDRPAEPLSIFAGLPARALEPIEQLGIQRAAVRLALVAQRSMQFSPGMRSCNLMGMVSSRSVPLCTYQIYQAAVQHK